MSESLPTWHKQALERGINYIVIVYSKAEGFVFCPSNLEQPFRVGGDYHGCCECNAEGALYHYHNYLNEAYRDQIAWFIPYVRRVGQNEDFSLDEMNLNKRKVSIIEGDWPW